MTLRGQVVSEAYRKDPAGQEELGEARQPWPKSQEVPGCLALSVDTLTPLTFSLTPYQNVFLSHTPLTFAPLLFSLSLSPVPPPQVSGSAVPPCGHI